jgi:hypothetical protein
VVSSGAAAGIIAGELAPDGITVQPRDRRPRIGAHGTAADRGAPGAWNFPKRTLNTPVVPSSAVTTTNPGLGVSVDGLNHRDQRLANGGNQFSLEPPDQALCVGNGFVLESVNTVIRVKSLTGANLSGVVDVNSFFGYAPQIDRTTGLQGPFMGDMICYYDPDHQRWYIAAFNLSVVPATGAFTGETAVDVAVSDTSSPFGSWTIYSIPTQNNGTEGTPVHANCPCIGDYPHIGADANGVFITTNEYPLFVAGFNGAQIYVLSKSQLATTPMSIDVQYFPNTTVGETPGFTVWPAQSSPSEYATEANGTEFLLSTLAGDGTETGNPTGTARKIGVWAITNTASLNTPTPDLRLTSLVANSQVYTFPPSSDQKPGDFPLGQCINDTTAPTPFGPGCWQNFFLPADEPDHDEVIARPDSLDSRMQQTWYVNGMIWGASGTGVMVGGEEKAGIAWFGVDPEVGNAGKLKRAHVRKSGYVAVANNNLSMPAIAMRPDGKGVIAATLLGEDYHPSAAYIPIDESGTTGPVHVAATGVGVQDGFSGYKAFGDPPRPRWGDYGAAVVDGNDIWFASEWIAQTCTLAQYMATPFGSCGGTRTSLANWATRVSKLTP